MQRMSRKTWCRGAFLTLCVAPTLLVAIWILKSALLGNGNAGKEDWEREVSSRLGLTIRIGEVTYPRFGLVVLTGVELSDPETEAAIARATAVEVANKADGYAIEVIEPEMEAAQLGRLSQVLHERLLCQGNSGFPHCEISASELTLNDKTVSRTLVNVQAALEPAETGPRLTAIFHWPEAVDSEHAIHWSLFRNLELSPPATTISLNTHQSRLPCRWAASFWTPLERLGSEAEFRGEVVWLLSRRASAEVRGTFSGVDLDTLVSEQFPQVLSGRAVVKIDSASIEDGRLRSAAGMVEVQAGGRVSRSLLQGTAEHLQLRNEAGSSGNEVLTYRRLAGGFRMDRSQLQVSGSADAEIPGVLMTNRTGPLLKTPPNHSTSVANLARVLLPDSRWQVPLASQTSGLVQLLGVPPPSPTAQDLRTARGGHIPTRLSPAGSSKSVIRER
jgi:hypothetical protein